MKARIISRTVGDLTVEGSVKAKAPAISASSSAEKGESPLLFFLYMTD